jgi:CubicO group peptidase (beta-lactamase class C family)
MRQQGHAVPVGRLEGNVDVVAADEIETSRTARTAAECGIDLTGDLRALRVPGLSAVVVKNGEIVCTAVAGTADINSHLPVTPDTVFTWASVSKTVTAAALMQLFEQGRFRLDDDIGEHLGFQVRIPACPNARVTFRHLLTHTSGIKDSKIYDALYVDGDSPIPLAEFIPGYLAVGGKHYRPRKNFRSRCPGTIYEYSNIGAGAIGYLVEVMSGVPFEQYVAEHIFTPLGMTNTSFRLSDLERSSIALPNGTGPLQGFPTFPDGTLRSSPSHLGKFLIAHMNGGACGDRRILEPATVREIFRNQTAVDSSQGLIWHTMSFGGNTLWGHSGDDPGISSNMFFDPATRIGVLLVANGEWKHDARRTMRRLFEHAASH